MLRVRVRARVWVRHRAGSPGQPRLEGARLREGPELVRRALALELGERAAQHARDAAQLEDLADHLLEVRLLRGRVGVGVGVRVRVRVRVRVKVGVRVSCALSSSCTVYWKAASPPPG